MQEVERELQAPNVWDDPERAQALGRERRLLERVIHTLRELASTVKDAGELLELAKAEDDSEMAAAVESDLDQAVLQLADLEFRRMFSGEMDAANAFIDIQAGQGGTEAQDWAEMMLRMYLRWGEDRGFKTEMIEVSSGEVAGIKSATVRFEGEYAFGWLRTETGVHRLVRKSPFDSSNRRHTSFASVFVSPEIDDDIEIDVKLSDLRIDTYRASGAGGQHVNKTDSAVRITHEPSGIVVQCQNERSQLQNRIGAMRVMKAKLYELEQQKKDAEFQNIIGEKKDIAWGSQIRSYVFQPYQMVKDHRTNHESGNLAAVMDGALDPFIEAYLTMKASKNAQALTS